MMTVAGIAALVAIAALLGFVAGRLVADRVAQRELAESSADHERAVEELEARNEERWAAVEDLAHELRNPLAVMATGLDVALGDDGTPDDLRRAADVVRKTVDRAADVVDDLIIFARNETPEARRTDVDLFHLLTEVVAEYRGPIDA